MFGQRWFLYNEPVHESRRRGEGGEGGGEGRGEGGGGGGL